MDIIKVTFELRFSKIMELFPGGAALRAALVQANEEDSNLSGPLSFRIEDESNKRIVVVNARQIIIDVEQPRDLRTAKRMIQRTVALAAREFTIPSIARWGMRTNWISSYDGTFQTLRDDFKERFFTKTQLLHNAYDVGLSLTYQDNQRRVTLTAGPMELSQLGSQVLFFPSTKLPDVFTYADIDLGDTNTHEFSERFLSAFLDESSERGNTIANDIQLYRENGR